MINQVPADFITSTWYPGVGGVVNKRRLTQQIATLRRPDPHPHPEAREGGGVHNIKRCFSMILFRLLKESHHNIPFN